MILKNLLFFPIFILLFLASCNQNPSSTFSTNWQLFAARDDGKSLERPLLYRALVPSHWKRQDPLTTDSIADTTKSICEFYIQEENQTLRLTLHTFPILQNHLRIPPQAQVSRWRKQFEDLDPLAFHVSPDSHGGFSGLYFEGKGILQGQPIKVMGWSMQLANGYERQLNQDKHPLDRYKRADYTIKASGSPALMNKHRPDILAFAQSFELIDELPSPL